MIPSIPDEMRALVLDGIGFAHLQVRRVPVPRPGPRQMLARVDAAGICTSLIKLVEQGPAHAQVYGWDLERFPLILGDEGCVTLVEVGQELTDRYHRASDTSFSPPSITHRSITRERYPDGGRGVVKVAVGYTLPGHLAEYILITEETVAAGCLLPVRAARFLSPMRPQRTGVLLRLGSRPLTCTWCNRRRLGPRKVVKGLKPGGVTVVIGAGAMGRMHVDVAS